MAASRKWCLKRLSLQRLRPEGIETNNLDAKAFTDFVAAEVRRWAPLVRASGARHD